MRFISISQLQICPKIQAVLDMFCAKRCIKESSEVAAANLVSVMDDNIDWVSSSYASESSELIQLSSKQAVYNYVHQGMFKRMQCIGYAVTIKNYIKVDNDAL